MVSIALIPGANTGIPGSTRVTVAVGWEPKDTPGLEIDASAFMIGENGRVATDERFVFYGSRSSPDGSVQFPEAPSTGSSADCQAFVIGLTEVPGDVASVDICVTIHEGLARKQSLNSLKGLFARLLDTSSGEEIARFDLPVSTMKETAVTLASVYRRNGQWKFRAVGQGFAGGLAPLARQYGVDVADEAPAAPPVEEKKPAPPPPVIDTPKPVRLSKVTLEKQGQSVSLEKKGTKGYGQILFNLNWDSAVEEKRGFLAGLMGGNKGIDLDLGCLYELYDGRKGVVQALGEAWGDYRVEPYIQLAGDDRTGAVTQGETIRINGNELSKIHRILVFAFIYDGIPNWAAANGVATVTVPDHPDIEVRLDNPKSGQDMCAIALIEHDNGQLKVTKEERYFRGHKKMDRAYGWNLRWTAGSKD